MLIKPNSVKLTRKKCLVSLWNHLIYINLIKRTKLIILKTIRNLLKIFERDIW